MWYNNGMGRNFWVRLVCGIAMFAIALASMYAFNGQFFKVLVIFVVVMAAVELLSFLTKKRTVVNVILLICELIFLIYGSIFIITVPSSGLGDTPNWLPIWYLIFGVCGYDIFAYLCGKILGGKIIKHHRPFPIVSPNKTWEGTVLGLVFSTGLVAIALVCTQSQDWAYLLCGVLALIGDLYESYLKRLFKVKDSNEILEKNKFFRGLELLVGGSKGHGGYLDRIDSMAFAATVLFIILYG